MSYPVLGCATNVWNHRGSRICLDLGLLPLRSLLAHPRSLGNKPDRFLAEPGSVADTAHGGPTTTSAELDNVRTAVGCDCTDEYRGAFHVSLLPALAALSFTK